MSWPRFQTDLYVACFRAETVTSMPVPTIYEEMGFDRNYRELESGVVLSFPQL